MAFKPKPNKKIDASPIITLDKTHEEKMKTFHHNETIVIPELEDKCRELEANGECSLLIKNQIQKLRNQKKKYLLDNSKYIFDYFENKKDISSNNTKPKLLENFFGVNKEKNIAF